MGKITLLERFLPLFFSSANVAVTVRISGAEADIHSGADAATAETVLRILKSC